MAERYTPSYHPNSIKALADARAKGLDHKLTPEDRSKGGRIGGKVAGRRKLLRDYISEAGELTISPTSDVAAKLAELYGLDPSAEITADLAVVLAQYRRAIVKGDTEAAKYIRDTSGQAPAQLPPVVIAQITSGYAGMSDSQLMDELSRLCPAPSEGVTVDK